jgi:RNA polymerase sigma-54 factor
MKTGLQLNLTQNLAMTPQLQQAIRFLQLSSLDLLQEIQQSLYNNPLLELEEETENLDILEQKSTNESIDVSTEDLTISDWEEKIPEELPLDIKWDDIYEPTNYKTAENTDFSGDEELDRTTDSLKNHLIWQLHLAPFSKIEFLIGEHIIDSIDENGMLAVAAEDIQVLLGGTTKLEDVHAVLYQIQQFDPPGVGARTLSESLLIQLNQLSENTEYLNEARLLVSDYINLLGENSHQRLQKITGYTAAVINAAVFLIRTLSPHPGDRWNNEPIGYIVPDARVHKSNGFWHVLLNEDITPKLKINEQYASLVRRGDSSQENDFIKSHLQEARWLIRSIENRNETLLRVASCIIKQQQEFFEQGPIGMKPMILADIAEELELHESTISRVTTQKYIDTPLGIFELKYFFSSHVKTSHGEEFSSTAIRAILKRIVSTEDPVCPLSDSKLTFLLTGMGIQIARRTVSKYRESAGIATSNKRKCIQALCDKK